MATAGANEFVCNLVKVGTLELEEEVDYNPWYNSVEVLSASLIMVVDSTASKLRLYSRHDGKLLATSDRLALPWVVCAVDRSGTEVAVTLDKGQIEIMSVESTGQSATIRQVRTLNVTSAFENCYGVAALRSEKKIVVSGRKLEKDTRKSWICWGLVSYVDGHVGTIHNICKYVLGGWSYLALSADDSTVYISCWADNGSPDNGVYACDVIDGKQKFMYCHIDLTNPKGICVDRRGFIYVCCWKPPCIHQLTEKGEPVTVHRDGMPPRPRAMCWEEQQRELYVTSRWSKKVCRFCPVWSGQQFIPAEVLKMDARSLQMYKEALRDGKEKVYRIRVMVVGQYGVGKTTLTKRLLGKDVNISDRKSTEGIDIHIDCCKVSLATGEWTTQETNAEQYTRLKRLVKLLNECVQKQETSGEQEGQGKMDDLFAGKEHDKRHWAETGIPQQNQSASAEQDINSTIVPTTSEPADLHFVKVDQRHGVEHAGPETTNMTIPVSEDKSNEIEKEKDTVMKILQMVNENADKLENNEVEYAALAMWDFAGQYVFYTTHQTFLTSRTIYLLVTDLSQQITDFIKDDEYFLDTEGIKLCKVHDLIEIWLNSIHSCAPSPETGIPPVILVATHVDKIPEKFRQEVIDEYFKKLRYMLRDKPTTPHLVNDVAIDNTQCDPSLDSLKRRIFELASQQPYWGEEKPARWLPLEQAIMTLKASGVKVAPLSLVEEINRSGSVRIEDHDELDLFLRFQHETGTILYFSVEGLREKIVLDPQWLIDALKSLITAETFFNFTITKTEKKNPAITSKWYEFKEKGKLTHELIDAIWTKEMNPEFYNNKEHILLLMEKLNIIARPISYLEDGKEVKVENYFIAPCMLRETTPTEVITPKLYPGMENSSVLSYVFVEKFLPSPIFHRLLAACVVHWPIAKMNNSENLIFCGCCVFHLDLHHRLTVFFREHVIFVRIARMGTTKKSFNLCIKVREFITMTLSNIIGNLGQSLQFELSIRCPKSDGYSVDCLIPVVDLQQNVDVPCFCHDNAHLIMSREVLKFWFQEAEIPGEAVEDNVSPLQHENLSERQLGRLSLKIGREFPRLGLELELCEANIQQIQNDYPDAATACLMILVQWKQQNDDKATFRNLKKAFKTVGIDVGILKSVDTTGDRASCLPQNMLDKQPEDRHLNQISRRVGKEYVHLGVELGVSVSRIQQIRIQHPRDVPSQCLEIMREWRLMQTEQATFRNLEQAFRCVCIDTSILKLCVK